MNHKKRMINIFDELKVKYKAMNNGDLWVNPYFNYFRIRFDDKNHVDKVGLSQIENQSKHKERIKNIFNEAGTFVNESNMPKEYADRHNLWPTRLSISSQNRSIEIYFDENDNYAGIYFT